MARPSGSRDKQFDARRRALIALARQHLSRPEGRNASWRDLATASGVSTSTLAHYFGDRQTLIAAILEHARHEGDIYLAMAARPAPLFAPSVHELVGMLGQGLDRGVLALQVIGLTEGLGNAGSAGAYLGHHLEPILAAIGARLDAHVERAQMRPVATRFAAIGLLAPMVIARLHQTELGGHATYPMSLPDFDQSHADAFVRAHRSGPESGPPDH
jgi:AcrR family transcriptional regulator